MTYLAIRMLEKLLLTALDHLVPCRNLLFQVHDSAFLDIKLVTKPENRFGYIVHMFVCSNYARVQETRQKTYRNVFLPQGSMDDSKLFLEFTYV